MSQTPSCQLQHCGIHPFPTFLAYLRQGSELVLLLVALALLLLGLALPKLAEIDAPDRWKAYLVSKKEPEKILEKNKDPAPATICCTAGADRCPADCTEPSDLTLTLAWMLRLAGGWMLLWRVLRFSLWLEFYRRGLAMRGMQGQAGGLLQPQRELVDKLHNDLSRFSLEQPGPTIALRGAWGSGKSHVLSALLLEMEQKEHERVATVFMSVWREQSERSLHVAIVEAILSHPLILHRCFAAYPNRLILRKLGHALTQWLPRGLHLNHAGMDADIDPRLALPLLAQRELEVVVARARAQCLRIVLILDEVDRATIEVAQAALVLTKRSLNLPGLAVLLAYVEEQLRLKVFNPRHNHIPELHQTFLMNIEHHLCAGNFTWLKDFQSMVEAILGRTESGQPPAIDVIGRYWEMQRLHRDEQLAMLFLKQKPHERTRIISQSEEKYLSFKRDMPALRPADIADVYAFNSLHENMREPYLAPNTQDKYWRYCIERVVELTEERASWGAPKEQTSSLRGYRYTPPAIRHMEGRLYNWLPYLTDDDRADSLLSEYPLLTLACLAAIAWRSAQNMEMRICDGGQ